MLTTPVFRPWRPIWDLSLGSATRKLDELATKRNRGRNSPPQVSTAVLRSVTSSKVQSVLQRAKPPKSSVFFKVVQQIKPLLLACVWPRWLLLEAALEEASRSGALDLSALILRTQIEELDTLRIVADVLSALKNRSWDDRTLVTAVCTLRDRLLPRLQTKSAEQLQEPAAVTSEVSTRPSILQRTYDQLGEYVHPNYGSHILSIRPHSSEAADIFVSAFIAVYEAFLALPWTQECEINKSSPTQPRPERQSVFLDLAESTSSYLSSALPPTAGISPSQWIEAADCYRRCAELESHDEGWIRSLETDNTAGEGDKRLDFNVGAIGVLREQTVSLSDLPESIDTASKRLRYALLVRTEQQLVEAAQNMLPGTDPRDGEARISLLCSGMTFAINITEFKLESLARHAAWSIVENNPLGAALAVRSMMEHHALAAELGSKMLALWKRAERAVPSEQQVDAVFVEAERQIARVLAGSTGSSETSSAWRRLWETTVKKPYNVLDPIRSMDSKEPGFLKTYGLLSHVIHGTVGTGGDLLGTPERSSGAERPLLAQLALFLAKLCNQDTFMQRQATSILAAHRLQVTADANSTPAEQLKKMRILEGQKLKLGRDVFGSGTAEDPYHFRRGLLYHDAYYHWLKQEGIKVQHRMVDKFKKGIGDRVETEDGRILCFINDTFTLE